MRCAALCLFLALCLSAWPQALPSSPSSPAAPAILPGPWVTLDQMLAELEANAISLAETSERLESELVGSKAESESLRTDLGKSRKESAELSSRLASSEIRLEALSSSLERVERSLAASQALALARDRELWLWRSAAGLASVVAILALVIR